MRSKSSLLFLALIVLVLAFSPAVAQEGADAHIRVAHLVAGAPNVDVFVNDEPGIENVAPEQVSAFLAVEPGTISVTIAPTGESLDAAIIKPFDVEVEAGFRYTIAVMGQVADNDLHPLVINETEAMEGIDLSTGTLHITVNNMAGSPPLTWMDDVVFGENVGYGEADIKFTRSANWDNWKAFAADDPDNIVIDMCCGEGSSGFWEPSLVYFRGFMGSYPGAPFEDYTFAEGRYSPVNGIEMLASFSGLGLTYGKVEYEFDTFLAAVEAAGLTEMLSSEGAYTFLAPTNDAFAALPEGTLDALMADPEALRNLVLYHVVEGDMSYDELVAAGTVKTLQGSTLSIVPDPAGEIPFASLIGNGETMIGWVDYPVTNGRVFLIDNTALLMPPEA